MIRDVPSSADFETTGAGFLNLAWESVMTLSRDLDDAAYFGFDEQGVGVDEQFEERYWKAVQRPLAIAVALAQQGSEFLLKSRVAKISPFLLLSGSPSDWPSGCAKRDTQFADFRTIDAQDLIRAHDTVTSPPLTDEFKQRYDQLRRIRNTIMHTVDRRVHFTPTDAIKTVLEISHSLLGPNQWIGRRRQSLSADLVVTVEYSHEAIVNEFMTVIEHG